MAKVTLSTGDKAGQVRQDCWCEPAQLGVDPARAADGVPIRWVAAEPDYAQRLRRMFTTDDISRCG